MGPPCNSFVWMSSSHHKRNEENGFQGDWSRDQVHAGNLQVDVAVFFFAFAYMEGIVPALENPLHSCMWRSISVVALQNELSACKTKVYTITAFRCAFTDPGQPLYRKPFQFMSISEFFLQVERPCTCKGPHTELVTRLEDGRCRGIPAALAESASYPTALGETIVDLWVRAGVHGFRSSAAAATSTSPKRSWAASGSGSEDEFDRRLRAARARKSATRRPAASGSESGDEFDKRLRAARETATRRPSGRRSNSERCPNWGDCSGSSD